MKPKQNIFLVIVAFLIFVIFIQQNNPLVETAIAKVESKNRAEKRAYLFYATSKPYACSVMVFAERFKLFKKDPSIDILALVSGLDESTLNKMNSLGIKTSHVDIHSATGDKNSENRERYKESNTKLHIFKDWGYDKFVYLDADSLLMTNIDDLFDLPETKLFWAPRAFWLSEKYQPAFTTVLIVGKPSKKIYEDSIQLSKKENSMYDMDILNKLYRHQVGLLPSIYGLLNRNILYQSELPAEYCGDLTQVKKDLKLVHFTSAISATGIYGKPWSQPRKKPENIQPDTELYFELFEAFFSLYDRVCP
ncbi:hypothetical protein HK103_006564 [Boothiomyces macroporosus]|uniref:Uncharacterized protein n=1 Tax=Boothiomyces macroporosus TaxID=261099 RepID=A0AAD5UGV2_9FUNG|nr:hypothetical protein HK103_006564 [Boothiomyces macroporosus]